MEADYKHLELPYVADLTEHDQWLLWRLETVRTRPAEPAKIPYSAGGWRASVVNPKDWASFEAAVDAWKHSQGQYDGLGFVFVAGGGMVGIDLDDALAADGTPKGWAAGIVARFFDTYCEISPSGAGLKIWAKGSIPANLPGVKVGDGSVEMYTSKRYFTFTGRRFRGAPLQVEHHEEDLLHMYERLTARQRSNAWALQPLPDGRIPHGRQHSTLVSLAGTLRARRVCDEAIIACLLKVNEFQCERPGAAENIARIVRSTRAWSVK